MAGTDKKKEFGATKNATPEVKKKAFEQALLHIEKQYGKGAIMRLGEDAGNQNIEVIPTGCLAIDMASGIGGVPRGRIVEIYGPESSGKTTVTLHIIAEAQKQGGICAFIDAEHALDPVYAANLGVDLSNLYVSQPSSGEEALDITDSLARSGALDLIVVDSVAALTPRAEIEGEMGDPHVGLQARLMSQALRKLTANVSHGNTCVIFINQLRQKIGVMYGSPETTAGGIALKFYSSMRLDVRKGEAIKEGTEIVGNKTKIKFVKNKLAPPFKIAEFDMTYGKGISKTGSLVDIAEKLGIIEKAGSWFSYNGERLCQGRENVKTKLDNEPELYSEIETKVKDALSGGKADEVFKADPSDESGSEE